MTINLLAVRNRPVWHVRAAHTEEDQDLAHRWHEESKRRYEELAHQWLELAEQRQRSA
jgi:hypothetical protein